MNRGPAHPARTASAYAAGRGAGTDPGMATQIDRGMEGARLCPCGTDISSRSGNAKRCVPCAKVQYSPKKVKQ